MGCTFGCPHASQCPVLHAEHMLACCVRRFCLDAEASAWQKTPGALQPSNQAGKQPQKKSKAVQAKAGSLPRAAPAAAAAGAAGSDGSDFEDGAAQREAWLAAKRLRKAPAAALPSGGSAAASGGGASAAGKALLAREFLEIGPWSCVVDCTSPLGFSRFASDMQKAPSCRFGC